MPEAKDDLLRARPLEILALGLAASTIGLLLAGVTTVLILWLTSWFSAAYAKWANLSFNYWDDHDYLPPAMKNALLFGAASGLFLVCGIAYISKFRCPFRMGAVLLWKTVIHAYLFSFVTAVNAGLIGYFFPESFANVVGVVTYVYPREVAILNFAWIAGSVWGIHSGTTISILASLISFARKWRQLEKQAQI